MPVLDTSLWNKLIQTGPKSAHPHKTHNTPSRSLFKRQLALWVLKFTLSKEITLSNDIEVIIQNSGSEQTGYNIVV